MAIITENDQQIIKRLEILTEHIHSEMRASAGTEAFTATHRRMMEELKPWQFPSGIALAPVASFEARREIHPGLTASIAIPEGEGPFPVHVHAGGHGLRTGRPSDYEPWIREMASHGFVMVFPDFRLQPECSFEDQIDDMMATIAWIKENARAIDVEPERMTIGGHSSSTRLALEVLLRTLADPDGPRFKAMVSVDGFFKMPDDPGLGMMDRLTEDMDLPPFYMVVGSDDEICDFQLADAQKLRSIKKQFELHVAYGMPHDFMKYPEMDAFKAGNRQMMAFLKRAV